MRIATLIVTRDRREKLGECIEANLNQSFKPEAIVVIDNGSTDGTEEVVNKFQSTGAGHKIYYLKFFKNLGSARGFAEGIKFSMNKGFEWFWLMDDDCLPHQNALEEICKLSLRRPDAIYASYSIDPKIKKSLWVGNKGNKSFSFSYSLPFNGFFISRKIVGKIGFPDEKLFFRNDDTEYSFRARFYGFPLFVVYKSIIYHPAPCVKRIKIIKTFFQFYKSDNLFKSFYAERNFIAVYFAYRKFLGNVYFFYRMMRFFLNKIFELTFSKNRWEKFKNFIKSIREGIKLSYEISENIKRE